MNCLQIRRCLMAAPHEHGPKLRGHLAHCDGCNILASQLMRLDDHIADAAAVSVPPALSDRILLACRARLPWRRRWYVATLAASVAVGSVAFLAEPMVREVTRTTAVTALGPSHPAVAAINMVAARETRGAPNARLIDVAAMDDGLRRLGLVFRNNDVKVSYAAKCHLRQTDCDQVVVETDDGPASVFLVPDYPLDAPAVLTQRSMTALISPVGSGGFIVVAESAALAKRVERLLVKH
jgi:hypothetical protein